MVVYGNVLHEAGAYTIGVGVLKSPHPTPPQKPRRHPLILLEAFLVPHHVCVCVNTKVLGLSTR